VTAPTRTGTALNLAADDQVEESVLRLGLRVGEDESAQRSLHRIGAFATSSDKRNHTFMTIPHCSGCKTELPWI
jgi:hypothetical protein